MPHFAVRAAAAAFAFTLGLASVWLSGLASTLEAAFAEWLVPTSGVSVIACPMAGREEADREVYETVLREMFGGKSKDVALVVRAETRGCYFCKRQEVTAFEGAAAETLNDFNVKNRAPAVLPPLQCCVRRHRLLGEDEHAEIFGRRGAEGWGIFYERFPGASGYVNLSAVGFNRDHDEAFLYAANECGRGLCGTGWHVLLRRNARGWEIESRHVVWQY